MAKSEKPLSTKAMSTKTLQDSFLAAYVLVGSIKKASEAAGMSRNTVKGWTKNDVQGFRERMEGAKEDFREYLQDIAVERVQGQKPGDNPVLLITLLNSHWPEKYRRTGYYADTSAKEIMGEWKKWVKESKKHARTRDEVSDRSNAIEEAENILARKSKHRGDGD
jgi:hypothetical protein